MKKTILLGITGGIAAYKSVQLVSDWVKKGYDVHVLMSKNATEFVTPLTFMTMSNNKVSVDTFDTNFQYNVEHVALAKRADVFVIAPATANVIAKIAHGLADDMLTTTFLAARCKKIVCPAMNTGMLDNQITQENLERLRHYNIEIVESDKGYLACGDVGRGRLAQLKQIHHAVNKALVEDPYLKGKRILITAGPTIEKLDPVRFISNHSSGKMGYALSEVAELLGAEVTLISGPVNLSIPKGVKSIQVESASEMFEAVKREMSKMDIIIKAAAVADYRIEQVSEQKMKKQKTQKTLNLVENEDILAYLGQHLKSNQVLCGFAMETEKLIENATKKLFNKKVDMIIANDLSNPDAGFGTDTNVVTLIQKDSVRALPCMAKKEVALEIFQECLRIFKQKENKDVTNN